MIIVVLCGLGLILGIAVVVGFLDAADGPARRREAAARRRRWERSQALDDAPPATETSDHDG